MDLTYTEIMEAADYLEQRFKPLYEDAKNRYSLYTLRKQPDISEDIARQGQVNILSSLVTHSAHTIRADLLVNPTEFTVIPLAREGGGVPANDAKKADNLERSLATMWSQLNEGRRIDKEIIWHQLVSPFGVMILECTGIDLPDQGEMSNTEFAAFLERYKRTRVPWRVVMPDPLTCFFDGESDTPKLMVRRYKQLAREVERSYGGRKDFKEGNPKLIDGRWDWVSEDYEENASRHQYPSFLTEVDMVWLDDGHNIYHVALNKADNKGQLVWKGVNPFGRVSGFIVPGNVTPMRNPEDKYEPFLWSLMQGVDGINMIRTTRATASRNAAGPDSYIAVDPEVVKIYEENKKPLPKSHRWKRDELPYIIGEIKQRPSMVDPDMDKLEAGLMNDIQRFLPSPFVHILDPAVLKAATATSILHAAESGLRLYGPLMSSYDSQIKALCDAAIHSLNTYYKDETFYSYATGDEVANGKRLKAGEVYSFSNRDTDFAYRINVRTRSMSQAQASAQYEQAVSQWILPDGSKGPATFDDLIEAANYTDKEAQKEKLAAEALLQQIDPILRKLAMARAIPKIEMETGIQIPAEQLGLFMGGQAPAAQPSGMPNTAQRLDAPLVAGPEGGSGPAEGV